MESEKPKKPFGRSLGDFGVLKPGERKLLEACRVGKPALLGAEMPNSPTDASRVRAEFLRFLLLGGDEQAPVHERGVQLQGAYVEGELMLRSCRISSSLMLQKCFFSKEFIAQDTSVSGLFGLSGSHLAAGLYADRLQCVAGVFLRNGFVAKKQVRLLGAQIGGDLDCSGGYFEDEERDALNANQANIAGSVILNQGFKAKGEVQIMRAQIGCGLYCSDARFEALSGSALTIDSTVVRGAWFLNDLERPACIDASHTDVAVLVDDLKSWSKGSTLDGLRYGALGGRASTNGEERIAWLHKQPDTQLNAEDFRPQPWRQLQRVLREMGHTEDAKQVGIAFEKHQRKIGRVGLSAKDKNFIAAWWRRVTTRGAHFIFGLLAGYGYRPMRLVTWMLAVWLACGAAYWHLSLAPYRAIAPSAPLIFQDENYINCQPDQPGPPQPPANWYLCDELRSEYATFSPLAYSLDLMLPVVDLGQEKAWGAFIPAANAVWWKELFTHWAPGHVVRLITWFQILFGWVSSLLLVAIISGFSRRNDES